MKRRTYKLFAVVAAMAMAVPAIGATPPSLSVEGHDLADLHTLWSRYQQAVAKKDARALLAMYVSENVSVMGGIAPKSYAIITAANKQPVPRTFLMTAKENVVGEIKLPPDQTENLDIHSDGEIGSVSFDYRAKVGHGRIIWTTVHTNKGWKIASVVYSINVPAADSKSTSR